MKPLFSLLFLTFLTVASFAQTEIKVKEEENSSPDPATILYEGKDTMHQLYLDEPAEKLIDIRYEKGGKKVKGSLSSDGKRVLIKNYKAKARVKMTLLLASGERKELTRSSCYIDPVIPIL